MYTEFFLNKITVVNSPTREYQYMIGPLAQGLMEKAVPNFQGNPKKNI
jgi:hypothetical protein